MPNFPVTSPESASPEADALLVGALVSVFTLWIVWQLAAYLNARSIRRGLRARWTDALFGDWVGFPAEDTYGHVGRRRDWALTRYADGAQLFHEAAVSNRVVYTRRLGGLPGGWSFDLSVDAGAGEHTSDVFHRSTSMLLRAHAGRARLARTLGLIVKGAEGAAVSVSLSAGRLTVSVAMIAPTSLGMGRVSISDPKFVVRHIDALADELIQMAERDEQDAAAALALHLDPPSDQAQEAFISLMSGHPDSPELAEVVGRALDQRHPVLLRCARIYGVDERIWEDWNPSVHATSYLRTRVAVLERIPTGPGRVAFVRDLFDRFGLDVITTLLGSFEYDDGKFTTDDALFRNLPHWVECVCVLIEDAAAVVTPAQWCALFELLHGVSSIWLRGWLQELDLPRPHALAALEHAEVGVTRWLELLARDDSEEVVAAIMRRLEWGVEGGDGDLALEHAVALCGELAARRVFHALPLMHRALEQHGTRHGEAIERAITRLTAELDPGVVGGMSVAEVPATRGGLSASAHADAGALTEHAAAEDDPGVVLGIEAHVDAVQSN